MISLKESDIMRKVTLNMKEQNTFEIIKNFVHYGGNKKRISIQLNCTIRNVNLLINKYKTYGKEAFSHHNKNRKPKHSLSSELVNKIILLYENKYFDANWNHFRVLLNTNENINISYNCLYHLLTNAGYISPKCQRVTKRNKAKEIKAKKDANKKLTPIEEDLVVSDHILDTTDSHPRLPRAKNAGEVIQMDASEHLWFGNDKCTLHGAIDDATGSIVSLYFDKQETLKGYYHILYNILINYGIPYSFLTDNRTVFYYSSKNDECLTKDTFTQFGYACKTLGIDLQTTSIAQKKGRIERLWNTLQSRLPIELRLAGIATIEEANQFFSTFITKFNKQFALPINNTKNVFEKQPNEQEINYILAVLSPRKFDSGAAIKYNNHYFQTYLNNELVCFERKTPCLVIKAFDDSLLCSVDNQVYELRILERNKRFSKNFDNKTEQKPKKVYIPPMNHPWKESSFVQYVNSQKHHKDYVNV